MKHLIPLLLLAAPVANADFITEFGGGYKIPRSTSVVLKPECDYVNLRPGSPITESEAHRGRATASCGGDNPTFIGWPIAWERALRDEVFTVRVGWFHFSHWGDGKGALAELLGGDGRETHFDCVCATIKVNWTARAVKRR